MNELCTSSVICISCLPRSTDVMYPVLRPLLHAIFEIYSCRHTGCIFLTFTNRGREVYQAKQVSSNRLPIAQQPMGSISAPTASSNTEVRPKRKNQLWPPILNLCRRMSSKDRLECLQALPEDLPESHPCCDLAPATLLQFIHR